MEPFLLLSIRADDDAADNEYESFLTLAGLGEDDAAAESGWTGTRWGTSTCGTGRGSGSAAGRSTSPTRTRRNRRCSAGSRRIWAACWTPWSKPTSRSWAPATASGRSAAIRAGSSTGGTPSRSEPCGSRSPRRAGATRCSGICPGSSRRSPGTRRRSASCPGTPSCWPVRPTARYRRSGSAPTSTPPSSIPSWTRPACAPGSTCTSTPATFTPARLTSSRPWPGAARSATRPRSCARSSGSYGRDRVGGPAGYRLRSSARARALASGAVQLAARCTVTGAARLPERSRRKVSSVPAAAVPAAAAVTAAIRAPRLARQPVGGQRFGGRADVPDAEGRAGHGGGRGLGQHPAERRLEHPAERGLLPGDGAERDAQQHVVGELPPVQAGDPLVVEHGPGGRGQRGQRRTRPRPARPPPIPAEPGPQPVPAEAEVGCGQPAGRRGRQGGRGGARVDRRVPPPVPGLDCRPGCYSRRARRRPPRRRRRRLGGSGGVRSRGNSPGRTRPFS